MTLRKLILATSLLAAPVALLAQAPPAPQGQPAAQARTAQPPNTSAARGGLDPALASRDAGRAVSLPIGGLAPVCASTVIAAGSEIGNEVLALPPRLMVPMLWSLTLEAIGVFANIVQSQRQ